MLLVALSIAGPLFLERWFSKKPEKKESSSLALLTPPEKRPWIEIVNADVFLLADAERKKIRSLESGDKLDAGMIIATDATGRAIIHFQDGSIARIDRNTEFVLETATYDLSHKTLMVAMKLASGRIWSRIVDLATPASLWEIKTTNAVAVVRGTAFGIEYIDGVSRVIGSEDKVTVIPIDPKTNKRVEEEAVVITPDTYVEITKKGISPIRKTPREIKEADWMQEEKQSDKPKATEVKPIATPRTISRVTAKELVVEIDLQSKTIRENEKKALRAIAIMSDGTKRDVSNRVTWRVIGSIGSVSSDGVFAPQLIGTQAEFGSAVGSIVATFTTEDGQELIGTTPTFDVQATPQEELDLQG